jgi:uncharacterized protein (TIGR04222 family)
MSQINSSEIALYQRLQHFDFEHPDTQFSLSQRLAREQNWTPLYTQRVLNEYKKFAFLAVVANHPVTPSEQVDQAWHLHLTHTRSYWQEFCPEILRQPLHHEPTKGGQIEQQKFFKYYQQTLDSYHHFFGHHPPVDIWPNVADRFQHKHLQLLDLNQNWVIPKPLRWQESLQNLSRSLCTYSPRWQTIGFLSLFCALSLSSCVFGTNSLNPLDWTGGEFLAIYTILSIVTIFVAFLLRTSLRLPYRSKTAIHKVYLDPYEIAYLSSPEQAVDGIIISLLQQDLIEVNAANRTLHLKAMPSALAHPLEIVVAQKIKDGDFGESSTLSLVREVGFKATHNIQKKLEEMQLLISEHQSLNAKTYPVSLILSVFLLGLIRSIIGLTKGESIGLLLTICLALLIAAVLLSSMPFYRSIYGDKVLEHFNQEFQADREQRVDLKVITIYTFLGTMALRDPIFIEYKTMIAPLPITQTTDSCYGCGGCGI